MKITKLHTGRGRLNKNNSGQTLTKVSIPFFKKTLPKLKQSDRERRGDLVPAENQSRENCVTRRRHVIYSSDNTIIVTTILRRPHIIDQAAFRSRTTLASIRELFDCLCESLGECFIAF